MLVIIRSNACVDGDLFHVRAQVPTIASATGRQSWRCTNLLGALNADRFLRIAKKYVRRIRETVDPARTTRIENREAKLPGTRRRYASRARTLRAYLRAGISPYYSRSLPPLRDI